MTDGAWRLTDHTAAAGVSHGAMWLRAARLSLAHARQGGAEMWGLWIGTLHCVQAVHHVRKCVEMARANVPADVANDIGSYLDSFDSTVPDLKVIRDVLEHYEDGYALGTGNLQQPGTRPRQRTLDATLSGQWTAVPDYVDSDEMRPVLTIGSRFALDLTRAVEASEQLLLLLQQRVRHL